MGTMKCRCVLKAVLWMTVGLCVCIGAADSPMAAEKNEKDRPARSMSVSPAYPGVVVPQGEEVRLDLLVSNKGKADEDVSLELQVVPKGWEARIKTYNFAVTGVHVPSGETKTLTFLATPDKKEVGPGAYKFVIGAWTPDGAFRFEREIMVKVKAKEEEKVSDELVVSTSYPVLRGTSDAKFEFSVDVENKMDKDITLNLSARPPEDWEVNFKPAYQEKYISGLQMKSGQRQSIAVEVKPSANSKAGEYPIEVLLSAGDRKATAKLMVVLTGTYKIDAGTLTGLLSINAEQGKPASISVFVKNSGSAPQPEVSFLSFKPENWKVEFKPERITSLNPGELKQVEVTITPAEQALVGDYSVGLHVKGEKAARDVELRVTVKASSFWGWVGIGTILFVIAALCCLFVLLGRR
ncbi:MAG: COG1470 family protein [Thermodesulfobacteriota bacterium]